jgi:hypothetical protein
MDGLDIVDLDLSKGDMGSASGTGIEYLMNPKHKPQSSYNYNTVARQSSRSDFDSINRIEREISQSSHAYNDANTKSISIPTSAAATSASASASASASTGNGNGLFSAVTDFFGGFGADSTANAGVMDVGGSQIAPSEWERDQIRQSVPVTVPKNTERSVKKRKRQMLRDIKRFEEMDPTRFKVTVSEESTLDEIEDEFDIFNEEYDQQTGLEMIRQTFTGTVTAAETLNGYVNPFDWQLEGMSDAVNENVSKFDHLFIKFQRQYKNVDIPVPIQIGFQLFVIGASVHLSNMAMKSMESNGLGQAVLNNPEVRNAVRNASVSTVQSYFNTGPPPPAPVHTTTRPPAPVPTPPGQSNAGQGYAGQGYAGQGNADQIPIFSSRPDLEAAYDRIPQPQQKKPQNSISMNINALNPHVAQAPGPLLSQEKGVSMNTHMPFTSTSRPSAQITHQPTTTRSEMKGPRTESVRPSPDTSTEFLMANLKTKLAQQSQEAQTPAQQQTDWSVESVNSLLDDIMPPTSGRKRRNKSDKQSIMTVDI